MRTKQLLSIVILFFMSIRNESIAAQMNPPADTLTSIETQIAPVKKRVNFIISSRIKKVDPAPFSFQLQAWISRLFHRNRLFVVIAGSSEEMSGKVEKILLKQNAMIGNIWFDSHGHFGKRYSLFEIGKDEFNAANIKDSVHVNSLRRLAVYCDAFTKAGIGACYGGATYSSPAIEHFSETRMNGDSLMISLSRLLNNATVFGAESWVMTKPGIFGADYAMAGYPLKKKFKDPFFEPVWQRLGMWNRYEGATGSFASVPSISIDGNGEILEGAQSYLQRKSKVRKQQKHMTKLKTGNYNLAYLYQ